MAHDVRETAEVGALASERARLPRRRDRMIAGVVLQASTFGYTARSTAIDNAMPLG